MSFEFIDLTESFQKIVTEKFATILTTIFEEMQGLIIFILFKEKWGLSDFYA